MKIYIFLKILTFIPCVFCNINTPGKNYITKNVGQDVVFMWSTTNGNNITSATWGLLGSDGKTITPQFIYISTRTNAPVLSGDLDTIAVRYKGRVSWVGDLSAGYAWFKITNLTLQDTNQYVVAIREQGQNEASQYSVHLTVTAFPIFLSFPTSPYPVKAIEGKNLVSNCTAIGPPTPKVQWFRLSDDKAMTNASVTGTVILTIKNVQQSLDSGTKYKCVAENNPSSPASTLIEVIVLYPPIITHFGDDMMINEGSLIKLNCSASGSPQPNITWSKGKLLGYGGSLRIPSATRNDTGNYTCTAKNHYGRREHMAVAHIHVTVKYKPFFVYWTKHQIITETAPLNLTCIADGYPAPSITWTKSPGTIRPSVTTGNEYSIVSVNRSDTGTYICTASNELGSAKKIISVAVQYKPTISKELSSSKVSSWNGKRMTLNCTVSDGLPTPNITWYKPNDDQISTGISKRSQLVITTTSADYGLYKCKATNIAGTDEHLINVTQLFKPGSPNITILDQDIQASSVTVRWTKPDDDGGSPVIGYKVQINSTNPPQEQNTEDTEHEFTGLTKNTRYEVKVYARNAVGYGSASIVIFTTKKRGAPPLPSFHLTKSKTTITLEWTKPDENGGTIKNYTVYQKLDAGNTFIRINVVLDLSNLMYAIQVKDLEPGHTYWFIVTATNEFGESEIGDNKGEEVYVPSTAVTAIPTPTTEAGPNKDGRKGSESNDSSPVVIAGAVGAVIFFLIAVIIIIIILRKKNILGRGIVKNTRSDRAAYHNDIDPDSVTQQGAAASLGEIPTYAAVDVSKKKKKKTVQNDIPNYAQVDKSKKKHPGEIVYAELADFHPPGTAVEPPRPITYTGTDYADITQFQQQDEPEATYANLPSRGKKYTYVQDK